VTNPDSPTLVSSETLERLRTAGFSEHEIDDLLARARAATAAPPSPATRQPAVARFSGQQAPMTGAISNVSTVAEQAPHAIPAVQAEIAIAGEKKAPASRRFRAFAAVANIAAVVALLSFGVSLELSKLQDDAALATAQGEVARQTALVAELRQKGEADEANYRTEITQQTALVAGLRQQSEAKEAEYQAEFSKQTALVQRAEAALADANAKIAACSSKYPK
jgi:hypothetical protein